MSRRLIAPLPHGVGGKGGNGGPRTPGSWTPGGPPALHLGSGGPVRWGAIGKGCSARVEGSGLRIQSAQPNLARGSVPGQRAHVLLLLCTHKPAATTSSDVAALYNGIVLIHPARCAGSVQSTEAAAADTIGRESYDLCQTASKQRASPRSGAWRAHPRPCCGLALRLCPPPFVGGS